MEIELGKIETHQQKGLFSPVGIIAVGCRDFHLYLAPGLVESFREQRYILVRTLDAVKRCLGLIAHKHAFPADFLRGRLIIIKVYLFSHKWRKSQPGMLPPGVH